MVTLVAALSMPPPVEPQTAIQPVALPPQGQPSANVFDYALPLQPSHRSIADYAPNLQGRQLANPATAADQVLRSLVSFHKDTQAMRPAAPGETPPSLAPQSGGSAGAAPGPAAQRLDSKSILDGMRQVVTEMGQQSGRIVTMNLRSQMLITVGQQIPTSVNSLTRQG